MTTRYDLLTAREGRDGKTYFTKIGVAFPNKSGEGFSLSFEALPIPNKEGEVRVLMMVPRDRDAAVPPNVSSAKAVTPAKSLAAELDDDLPF